MRISLEEAVSLIKKDGVIGMPTETVYGLAAHYTSKQGIEKIFALKGRPKDNPLILHAADIDGLKQLVGKWDEETLLLAKKFWPGPLTLIVPANTKLVPAAARANLPTIGVRIPSHPLAQTLLQNTGPLVAPSANLSGKPSGTCFQHLEKDFGATFPILDGGPCQQGIESTIMIQYGGRWQIARLGAIPTFAIDEVLGRKLEILSPKDLSTPLSPGQKYRHYAPNAELILGKSKYNKEVPVVVGFFEREYKGAEKVIYLGSLKSPEEITASLYAVLRGLDEMGIAKAWVDWDFPKEGLLEAVAERLFKAATSGK